MTFKITILGTGHFGTSLANYLHDKTINNITVASRSTEIPPQQAVQNADIIILAIPSYAYQSTVPEIVPSLRPGTVVIDASNRPLSLIPTRKRPNSAAHTLRKLLPSGIHVAKALNTVSAIRLTELTNADVFTQSTLMPFACDEGCVKIVQTLVNDMGFTPTYKGDLSESEEVEAVPHTFFPSYKSTMYVALLVWAWWILYCTLNFYIVHGSTGGPLRMWETYSISMFLMSTGETAQTMFAVTFLAGPVATLFKAFGRPLRKVLIEWLDKRKQLGLAAFVFVSAHAISGVVVGAAEGGGWKRPLFYTVGVISFVLFGLLAVCSSGSTAATLSWAEFRAVFAWLGTAAFVLGILHQGLWGGMLQEFFPDPSTWVGDGKVMPIYWLGIILPLFVVLMRAITWTPCVIWAAERRSVSTKTFSKGEIEA